MMNNTSPNINYKFSKITTWGLFFVAFIISLYSLVTYLSQPQYITFFLNPDFNAYTYMAYNLIYEHGSIFYWHIGTAPYFIPEIAFLYLTTLFIKSSFFNLLIYALSQIIFISIIIPAIFKAATQSIAGLRLGLISILVLLLSLVIMHPFYTYGQDDYLSALFSPGFHYGAALLVFTATFLFLKILSNPKFYLHLILFTLLVLAGMSDPLTYVYFTFPMIATLTIFYFFKDISNRKYLTLVSLLVLSFITAYVFYHLIPIQYVQLKLHMSFTGILLLEFIKTILFFIQTNIFFGILWLVFMMVAPFSVWRSLSKKQASNRLLDYVILLQFITVIVSTPLIILAIGQVLPSNFNPAFANFFNQPSKFYNELQVFPYRYFVNYIMGPVFIGFPLLMYKHVRWVDKLNKNNVYIIILCCFTVTAFLLKAHHFYANNLLHFQEPAIVCFDQDIQKYHLSNGISDSYLTSNLFTAYNQDNSHIALVDGKALTPTRWQNTLQVYQYSHYNFAIPSSETMISALTKRFGQPTAILSCTGSLGKYPIYVYNKIAFNTIFSGH